MISICLLQNILNANSELTSVFSSKERLSPLLSCLLDTGPSSDQVPQICLDVLARLTMQASCVQALAADRSALLLLLQLLHCAPACRSGALRVLYSLASTSELAWAAAKHGGVVYILQLVLPGQGLLLVHLKLVHQSLWVFTVVSIIVQTSFGDM
jgi:DnaJ family protein C protein 13